MNSRTESPSRVTRGWMAPGALGGWVVARLRSTKKTTPRLTLVERIALGPRQSLALIEAEGQRLLVATSAEGAPAFYPLQSCRGEEGTRCARPAGQGRVSW